MKFRSDAQRKAVMARLMYGKPYVRKGYHIKSIKGHFRCVNCGHCYVNDEKGTSCPPWWCIKCNPPKDSIHL